VRLVPRGIAAGIPSNRCSAQKGVARADRQIRQIDEAVPNGSHAVHVSRSRGQLFDGALVEEIRLDFAPTSEN